MDAKLFFALPHISTLPAVFVFKGFLFVWFLENEKKAGDVIFIIIIFYYL